MTVRPSQDRVLFARWSGNEITLDGGVLTILQEADIMGVVAKAATQRKAAKILELN